VALLSKEVESSSQAVLMDLEFQESGDMLADAVKDAVTVEDKSRALVLNELWLCHGHPSLTSCRAAPTRPNVSIL
jgi:hypothetical protein